ncbi:MAG: CDP-diacylglycerol--glycerol-3-phosphate 3-phosphatidyltransferase [Clostridiales bacterium]|nr:CDP-diacylglycerol--glycerol-3-phosphate 3-phosphatidyltransferase [Clostridiales bacterium]
MNLPTRITMARIAMIPIIIASFCLETALPQYSWIFIITGSLFFIASMTDFVDGYIARKFKMVTTLGKFLDPIADKVLVVAGLAFGIAAPDVVGIPYLMIVVTVVIIAREFAISLFRQIAASKNVILAAGKSGKYKTTFTMVALNSFLFIPANRMAGDAAQLASKVFWWIFIVSLGIAVILTVYSAIEYVLKNKQVFKDQKTQVEVIEEEDVEFPDEKIIEALEWCRANNSVEILQMSKDLGITIKRAFKIRVWLEIMDFVKIEDNQRVFEISDEDLEKIKQRKDEYYAKLGTNK